MHASKIVPFTRYLNPRSYVRPVVYIRFSDWLNVEDEGNGDYLCTDDGVLWLVMFQRSLWKFSASGTRWRRPAHVQIFCQVTFVLNLFHRLNCDSKTQQDKNCYRGIWEVFMEMVLQG